MIGRRLAADAVVCINVWMNYVIPLAVTQPCSPMKVKHFIIQGQLEFSFLLFIPMHAPPEPTGLRFYYQQQYQGDSILVLPEYLSFMKGIVDTEDLTSTTKEESRIKIVRVIRRNIIRKAIQMLTELCNEDRELYQRAWAEFGASLKGGVVEDVSMRRKLLKLLLFESSCSDCLTTLDEYLLRIPPDRPRVILCTDRPESPAGLDEGPEVLYMADEADWEMVRTVREYENAGYPAKFVELKDYMTGECSITGPEEPEESGWEAGLRRIMAAQAAYSPS